LKAAVGRYLNQLLDPIRAEFETEQNKALTKVAYPAVTPAHSQYCYQLFIIVLVCPAFVVLSIAKIDKRRHCFIVIVEVYKFW
jgi:hypothetical protein